MGVRQGCFLSPVVFNIHAEAMVREALSNLDEGMKVGKERVKAVWFVDDEAICQ